MANPGNRDLRSSEPEVKKLQSLLDKKALSALGRITEHAAQMDGLLRAVAAALPEPARTGIVAANLRDSGELLVFCRSAAVASRVRFETETVKTAALDAGFAADRVIVRVSRDAQA